MKPFCVKSVFIAAIMVFASDVNSYAVDPPYQQDMQRFATIMGALYHLDDLCAKSGNNWRNEFAELMELEEVDDDRRSRLTASFNEGYYDFSRLHLRCTPNAQLVLKRFIAEGAAIAKNIHTRFAE